jgi:hypothetical protein
MADENNQAQQQQFQLKIDPAQEQGIYSNAVSVHVNPNEVIIDFAYLLPNQNPTTLKLVSRINMPHHIAESFMNVFSNAMLDMRNRQKEQKK